MDGRVLRLARERLADQKANNVALRDAREAEAYRAIPALRTVDAQLRALVGEVIGIAAEHGGDTAAALARVPEKIMETAPAEASGKDTNGR